ncbi:MAG: PAS domain S-box protein [Propionibacteriales bacterium]|nr:PAS domain S-box protein [Propionibacteriales bacterium]
MRSFPQGALFAFDQDLRYLSAGGQGLADVGLSREMLEGRTIFEVFPPETVAVIEPLYRAALRGECTSFDVPFEGRVFLQRLAPVLGDDELPIAGLGFTQDVTDARVAEQTMRESEQRMRLSFDFAPIGQALVELDGRWRAVNSALAELTGYSEGELLEMSFQDITHPDDLDLDLSHLKRLVAGEISSYQMEKRYRTAAGGTVWVLLSVTLVRDDEQAPLYFISQIQDISERKLQHDALRDLIGILAHDLRTPTTVVAGFSEALAIGWEDYSDDERRDYVRRIGAASHSLQVLLDNSLTVSTLDENGIVASPVPIELDRAVGEALKTLDTSTQRIDISGLRPVVAWMDPVHLTQVLTNLVTNAVKYGGDVLTISTAEEVDGIVLSVSDNGPGVPTEFVPHLFDRFSRSAAARLGGQRGTGLGLHIVRLLLGLNGAEISYFPAPGRGAGFRLVLQKVGPVELVD